MEPLAKAKSLLDTAESGVRRLISDAAGAGEYEALLKLTSIAQRLASISGEIDGAPKPAAVLTARAGRANAQKNTYPRFHRAAADIVKIGWSKSDRSEYQHRAPYRLVVPLVAALEKSSKAGNLVVLESVLPIQDKDGQEFPKYQAYVVVAWLRAIGLITQEGRKGYRPVNAEQVVKEAQRHWESLPPL